MVGIALEQVLDAWHISVDIVSGQDREYTRHFHTRHNRERSRLATLFQAFCCCQFHRLVLGCMHARSVAAPHQDEGADDAYTSRYTDAGQGKSSLTFLEQIPRTDADNENRPCHPTA